MVKRHNPHSNDGSVHKKVIRQKVVTSVSSKTSKREPSPQSPIKIEEFKVDDFNDV